MKNNGPPGVVTQTMKVRNPVLIRKEKDLLNICLNRFSPTEIITITKIQRSSNSTDNLVSQNISLSYIRAYVSTQLDWALPIDCLH